MLGVHVEVKEQLLGGNSLLSSCSVKISVVLLLCVLQVRCRQASPIRTSHLAVGVLGIPVWGWRME